MVTGSKVAMNTTAARTKQNPGGKPGRSGPPGNMNNARHPWRVFWKRRALRPEDRWVMRLVENYEESIEEDRGRDLSFAEARVVEIAKTARVCQLLALAAFAENGIMLESVTTTNSPQHGETVTRKGDVLHPAYKELSKFMKAELDALKSIGLEKADSEPLSLTDYVEQRYGGKEDG